jgi:divalent metal cation (Fe/Co/Zn/Cd) transporter
VPSREQWLRSAIKVSLVSVAFGAAAGLGALVAGLVAGSLSLISFALDSLIDSTASILLVHRFHAELANDTRAARLEERAQRVISWLLIVAGLYVGGEAVRTLASGDHPERTFAGIAIAAISVLVLPGLAYRKRRLSRLLRSRALRADGLLTAVAAILAAITLISVILSTPRADSVAALTIALVLLIEGARGTRQGGPGVG